MATHSPPTPAKGWLPMSLAGRAWLAFALLLLATVPLVLAVEPAKQLSAWSLAALGWLAALIAGMVMVRRPRCQAYNSPPASKKRTAAIISGGQLATPMRMAR